MFFSKSCLKFVLKSLLFAGFCQKQLGRRSTASFWIVGGGRRGPTFNLRKSYNRGRAGILFGAYRVFFPFTGFWLLPCYLPSYLLSLLFIFFLINLNPPLLKSFLEEREKGETLVSNNLRPVIPGV